MHTLAIDIGGTKVSVARIDFIDDSPEFVDVRTVQTRELCQPNTNPTATDVLNWINQACEQVTSDHGTCDAIGVGFGGQFDSQTQRCLKSLHIDGWEDVAIGDFFSAQSSLNGVPIAGINDAKAGALAEATTYAQARPPQRTNEIFAYVTVSTGIGGAIALLAPGNNGVAIMSGQQSLAGEFGHLQVPHPQQSYEVNKCSCGGTACFERVCSGLWIEQRTGLSAQEYLNDEMSFAAWIADFTAGIWSAVTVLDPAVICIGGGMSAMGNRLTSALTQSLGELCSAWGRKPPEVTVAHWGSRSVLLGAALLAREVGNA